MFRDLPIDEKTNAITHALGVVFSLVGIPPMIYYAHSTGSSAILFGVICFGVGLLAVFFSSTTYHMMTQVRLKQLWRKIDHMSIYLLIAGTYTAYILKYLNDPRGISFLAIHWFIVLCGLVFKYFYTGKFEIFSTILYLLLGWMFVFIITPMTQNMPDEVFCFLLAGGLAYSFGVIFYVWERYKFNHTIWHLFVLTGAVCHYFGIMTGL